MEFMTSFSHLFSLLTCVSAIKRSLFATTHSLLTFPSTVCIPSHCWKCSARLETPRLRLGSSSVDSLADFDILLFWGRAGTCVAVLSCISNVNCVLLFFFTPLLRLRLRLRDDTKTTRFPLFLHPLLKPFCKTTSANVLHSLLLLLLTVEHTHVHPQTYTVLPDCCLPACLRPPSAGSVFC